MGIAFIVADKNNSSNLPCQSFICNLFFIKYLQRLARWKDWHDR